jgi:hypothetical protein
MFHFLPLFCIVLYALAVVLEGNLAAWQDTETPWTGISLNEKDFRDLRETILPDPTEIAWRELPWEISFYQGLQKAASEHKPLLLWTMNGHPFGCT